MPDFQLIHNDVVLATKEKKNMKKGIILTITTFKILTGGGSHFLEVILHRAGFMVSVYVSKTIKQMVNCKL